MQKINNQLLKIVSFQLFGKDRPSRLDAVSAVLKEARAQTVFTIVFPFCSKKLKSESTEAFQKNQEIFLGNILSNTNNFMEHSELHQIMTENDIPYCTLKGMSSAFYYPDPSLRDMGDVDYLVGERDFERAKKVVLKAGFTLDSGSDSSGKHIAFHREPFAVWEQHRSFNIPDGETGEKIRKEINCTIESSQLITLDGATCRIPDAFHHGLIMLLHVASHITKEGIGLRHLCDWAVFVQQMSNDEFVRLFENKLKSFGLWRFAQTLTLVSEKYLNVSPKSWAKNSQITDGQLDALMDDILCGGNFGKKDLNRYREIKYISNRRKRTVDDKHIFSQVISTLNQKTYKDYPAVKQYGFLLPVGWIAESGKYIGLLVSGKRKNKGTSAMLQEAAKRKEIYSKFKLFEVE